MTVKVKTFVEFLTSNKSGNRVGDGILETVNLLDDRAGDFLGKLQKKCDDEHGKTHCNKPQEVSIQSASDTLITIGEKMFISRVIAYSIKDKN